MEGIHPIKAWRESQQPRLTVEAAAERLEVTKATVSRWENWKRMVDRQLVPKVSRVTGIPRRDLRPDWADTMEAAE